MSRSQRGESLIMCPLLPCVYGAHLCVILTVVFSKSYDKERTVGHQKIERIHLSPPLLRVILPFLLALLLALPAGPAFPQELPIVTAIEIKGAKRIEEGAVRSRLSQRVGAQLSQEKTTDDITTIYKMGYFSDVKVEIEPFEGGVKAVYILKEKPTVIKVDFQGNKEFDDAKMKEIVTLNPGAIADVTLINDNAAKLRAFYEDEGYYFALIVPVVRKIGESDVAVTFQISEGDRVKIKEIRIEGNKALSAKAIRGAMKTKERGLFSFILGGGYYKKDEMKADVERIRDLYYDNGYLKVVVGEPSIQILSDRKSMRITIAVTEGEQFRVSSLAVSGSKTYPEADILRLLKTAPNKVFSKKVLQGDIAAITELYSNNGYALVSVTPDIIPDEATREVKVLYRINEGDRYRISRIDISGNTKTLDKVIRREIRVDEGDLFNAAALKRSYERLNNLQYFETVDISPKPNPEEKVVGLDVKVKEKSTGFLSVGGGYSSQDGVIGMVDITQANLFGRGQYLKMRAELGGQSSFYEFSFRDPWFLDKPLSFGAGIYYNTREYGDYDKKAKGFDVSLGKSFWEFWSASVSYTYEKATVYNVLDTASAVVKDQEGTNTTSAVTFIVSRDTRDNYVDPVRGSRYSLLFSFAGLGGSNAFIKTVFDSGWYFPMFAGTTIHLRGRVGYGTGIYGKDLPLYERFYVGGITTVRGFEYGKAGPLDINGEPVGGATELILTAEYIFPIVVEYKLKGLVFFDAGRGYCGSPCPAQPSEEGITFGTKLRYSAGAGLRWISPFGPIRIEWGYNLDKQPGEPSSRVDFSFGSAL